MPETTETAAVEAPERSPARATLAHRIDARIRAQQTIEDRQGAARRLVMIGEAATALATQLAGVKAQAAATLAQHALKLSGKVPKLVEPGRADLLARLAEAEEQAAAAGPALVIIEAEIASAFADHNRATATAAAATGPVVQEEITALAAQVQEGVAALRPLIERLAGARGYAYQLAYAANEAERTPLILFANSVDEAMTRAGADPRTPANGTEAVWANLAQRLAVDPDAVAA